MKLVELVAPRELAVREVKVPEPGQLFKCPDQADSLELIAETEGKALYEGILAEKLVSHAEIQADL